MVSRGSEVDVEYSKQKIINKFNTFVGYEAISSIKIEIFEKDTKKINITNKYVTKSKYSKKISENKNDKIKNSLYELEKLVKLK